MCVQAPAPPPATRSAAASAPATAPQLGAPGFGAAAPGLEQMDPALMSQIQLQMQMPFLLAAMQAFPGAFSFRMPVKTAAARGHRVHKALPATLATSSVVVALAD